MRFDLRPLWRSRGRDLHTTDFGRELLDLGLLNDSRQLPSVRIPARGKNSVVSLATTDLPVVLVKTGQSTDL